MSIQDPALYLGRSIHCPIMVSDEVHYPAKRSLPGGKTDPAGMEIDLWVRSKEPNTNNFSPFETFVHLFWDEVTW